MVAPHLRGDFFTYQFNGLELTPDERRAAYENWVLAKGFQDLARGVRESLEEAYFYLTMIQFPSGITTLEDIEKAMEDARVAANKLTFPALLEHVNEGLTERLAFDSEFLSLQKTRNCLEHRGGIVGAKDVEEDTGAMILSFPRFKMFYMRGEEEVEIVPGEVIDTQQEDNPLGKGEMVRMLGKRVTRTKAYALADRVTFTANDFYEIAMACVLFGQDLASKLPTLPPIDPETVAKA